MSIRKILTPPAPELREPADKVRAFTSELRTLVDDMVETMRDAPGVGLAAPQVGVGQRVIVVEYGEPTPEGDEPVDPDLYKLVNPEVVSSSRATALGNEGCLSLPGYYGEVERSQAVTVRAFTPAGEPTKIDAEGWLARILQHEIDHLDGILFIDRATEVWQIDEEAEAQEAAERQGQQV